jgi:hypothetical protein
VRPGDRCASRDDHSDAALKFDYLTPQIDLVALDKAVSEDAAMADTPQRKPSDYVPPPSPPVPEPDPHPPAAEERGGRGGLDPTRYGDWEVKGIAVDF